MPLTPGPNTVAMWKFNSYDANTVVDEVGDNHATVLSGTTPAIVERTDGDGDYTALRFVDLSTFVEGAASEALGDIFALHEWTVGFAIDMDSLTPSGTSPLDTMAIFWIKVTSNPGDYLVVGTVGPPSNMLVVFGGFGYVISSADFVGTGSRRHFTIRRTDINNADFGEDGVMIDIGMPTTGAGYGTIAGDPNTFGFGKVDNSSQVDSLLGAIDYFWVENYAMTDEEILARYESALEPEVVPEPPVAADAEPVETFALAQITNHEQLGLDRMLMQYRDATVEIEIE